MATTSRRFTKDHEWAAISEEDRDPKPLRRGISPKDRDDVGMTDKWKDKFKFIRKKF